MIILKNTLQNRFLIQIPVLLRNFFFYKKTTFSLKSTYKLRSKIKIRYFNKNLGFRLVKILDSKKLKSVLNNIFINQF